MPDDRGNFRGQGWSRAREDGWERAFARPKLLTTDVQRLRYAEVLERHGMFAYAAMVREGVDPAAELRFLKGPYVDRKS